MDYFILKYFVKCVSTKLKTKGFHVTNIFMCVFHFLLYDNPLSVLSYFPLFSAYQFFSYLEHFLSSVFSKFFGQVS